jgi:hypothetical protein
MYSKCKREILVKKRRKSVDAESVYRTLVASLIAGQRLWGGDTCFLLAWVL